MAKQIADVRPELVNDPTESLWELLVRIRGRYVDVEASPRALVDPRFAYRVTDVPAASHPTIAAALARVAGATKSDVVWDPFCGSGTELVERARFGAYARLLGTDRSPDALSAAQKNLAAAGVSAELSQADATTFAPQSPVTLVVTNPPMGRRVARDEDLRTTLDRFIDHVADTLAPGGRLVWISPFPERTGARLARLGLQPDFEESVDMGGFTARLQRAFKR
jgi:23S rRNA G2445 N2-methylase RlmL